MYCINARLCLPVSHKMRFVAKLFDHRVVDSIGQSVASAAVDVDRRSRRVWHPSEAGDLKAVCNAQSLCDKKNLARLYQRPQENLAKLLQLAVPLSFLACSPTKLSS